MMSRGYVYLLLLDQVGPVGGSVEHLEGKDGENVVVITRFLCGSHHLCWLRTASFWLRWQALSYVLTTCRVLCGPISRLAFITTISNRRSLLRVVLLLFGGRMKPRVKTSSWEQGANFDIIVTYEWLSYVRASRSQAYDVLIRFFSCIVYIDSSHHDALGYE
jgi:hypothetical protein